jgi:amino acid adenylation domain-containing protein
MVGAGQYGVKVMWNGGELHEVSDLEHTFGHLRTYFPVVAGNMFEQSPFNVRDFAKQRARWFAGLWLCVIAKPLVLWRRVFLGAHVASWAFCPLLNILTWCNVLLIYDRSSGFVGIVALVYAIPFWGYALGFFLTFKPSQFRYGFVEYCVLLCLQIICIPAFAVMEAWGVFLALTDKKLYVGFHVVQKEKPTDATDTAANAIDSIESVSSVESVQALIPMIDSSLVESFQDAPTMAAIVPAADTVHLNGQLNQVVIVGMSVHELMAKQSRATPDAVALVLDNGTEVTYLQFNENSDAIARQLIEKDAGSGTFVGMLLQRSTLMVEGIYGVLKSGAAYVPIDPDFPAARIEAILTDSSARLLLVDESSVGVVPASFPGCVVELKADGLLKVVRERLITNDEAANLPRSNRQSDLADVAYVMYTSGSSGKPKGVVVTHGPLSSRIQWLQKEYHTRSPRVLLKTEYHFAISEWEMFWTLAYGATLVIAADGRQRDSQYVADILKSASITHCFFVPSALKAALEFTERLPSLEHIICCGEALQASVCQLFYAQQPTARLHNLYGPTEGSMTYFRCPVPDANHREIEYEVLIGRPIDNTSVFLLDDEQNPVGLGEIGEIHFGDTLAAGYLGQSDLTKESFIEVTIPGLAASKRLYKTGDLAVMLLDGNMKYKGRVDRQVKLRGFRIELQAVETALQDLDGIKQVAVVVTDGLLMAFVSLTHANQLSPGVLETHCRRTLPEYMVPKVVLLNKLPLLPNSKVDLKLLSSRSIDVPGQIAIHVDNPADIVKDELAHVLHAASHEDRHSLATFASSRAGKDLMSRGVDSLGMVRAFKTLSNRADLEERTAAVCNSMRAIFMFAVILDHYASCEDGSACHVIMKRVVNTQSDSSQASLMTAEMLVRAIGNYKTMSGFMMISGFVDAATPSMAAKFGASDVVVVVVYFQMMYIMDPLFEKVICPLIGDPSDECIYYKGVHRWYLICHLICRLFTVVCNFFRVPIMVQVCLAWCLPLVCPPALGCISDEGRCTGSLVESAAWDYASWLPAAVVQGPLEPDVYGMFDWLVWRYYLWFAAMYVTTFHYGRPAAQWGIKAMQDITKNLPPARARYFHRLSAGAAFALFVASAVADSAYVGGQDLAWLQEGNYYEFTIFDDLEANLLLSGGMATGLMLQPVLLAVALSATSINLRLPGQTTLGCYVIHMYLNPILARLEPDLGDIASIGIGAVFLQIAILLLVCIVVQWTVGILFHQVLVGQFKICVRVGKKLSCCRDDKCRPINS